MVIRNNNSDKTCMLTKKANSMVLPTHSQTASDLYWLITGVYSDGKESLSYLMACAPCLLQPPLLHWTYWQQMSPAVGSIWSGTLPVVQMETLYSIN